MRTKAESSGERLQYDKDGQLIGKLISYGKGTSFLLLEPEFMYVMTDDGDLRVWGGKGRKLVEFAKNEQRQ